MPFVPHPALHPVFEALAYIIGYAVYRQLRTRAGDFLTEDHRWLLLAATALGALAGARLLGILEQAPKLGFHAAQLFQTGGGKTIVGGLLGGWLAVELAKLALHIRSRTGDLYAVPLALGIAIGRIGCFLAGLADDTYGTPTRLPWVTRYMSINFGDGIPRHPTQLYELVFLLLLAAVLSLRSRQPHPQGQLFRIFMGSYLGWRFLIDFLKPQPHIDGLNPIQWACLAGLLAVLVGAFSARQPAPQPLPVAVV